MAIYRIIAEQWENQVKVKETILVMTGLKKAAQLLFGEKSMAPRKSGTGGMPSKVGCQSERGPREYLLGAASHREVSERVIAHTGFTSGPWMVDSGVATEVTPDELSWRWKRR